MIPLTDRRDPCSERLDPVRLSCGLTSGGEVAGFLSPFAGLLFANISMLSNG